jgi:hypothetical protein
MTCRCRSRLGPYPANTSSSEPVFSGVKRERVLSYARHMEEPIRMLRLLAFVASSGLLLNLPAVAQTDVGPKSQTQQPVLATPFDAAAYQKALKNASIHRFLFSGGDPSTETPKVCATPLLESKGDPNIDSGIRAVRPTPDHIESGVKSHTDPIAVPPPVPACPTAKR